MLKNHVVCLSPAERRKLLGLLDAGHVSPRVLDRARVLLLADAGLTDQEIASEVWVGTTTVYRLRRRFAQEGLAATLYDRARPGGQPKLNREQQALVLALRSSAPPNGRQQWTMQELADKLVALGTVETISSKTVRRVLNRMGAGG